MTNEDIIKNELNKCVILDTHNGNTIFYSDDSIERQRKLKTLINSDINVPDKATVLFELDYKKTTFWINNDIFEKISSINNDYIETDELHQEIIDILKNSKIDIVISHLKPKKLYKKITYGYTKNALINLELPYKDRKFHKKETFNVLIDDKEYSVYDLKKEHEGYNDTPKTWWLCYAELPSSYCPSEDDEEFIPYCSSSIQRQCYDISFTQRTSSKFKWGGTSFSNRTMCNIKANNKLIYSFGTSGGDRGMSFAMSKAQYMITILREHPFDFFNPEKEEGRKIFWYGLPAFVRLKSCKWEIEIVPDYSEISAKDWWNELKNRESKLTKKKDDWDDMENEEFEESKKYGTINWGDAFEDAHIGWFRD